MGLTGRIVTASRQATKNTQPKLLDKDINISSVSGRGVGDSLPILGLLTCAVLAVLLPRLHNITLETGRDGLLNIQTGEQYVAAEYKVGRVGNWTSAGSQQRKDNATVEATLEAAVRGAFLADAASLSFQGYVI